ncbi:hypothetical protein FRB90_008450 [Tulasnella sp. 427]|nr:hypothetical protein FRB90_008450 [Tulasnella sp. 427]
MTEYNDWAVRIRVNKYQLKGSFSVLIFLGDIPEDSKAWMSSPSYVGAHRVFGSVLYGEAESDEPNAIAEGFVQLNQAIAERSGLASFDAKEVVPYLKSNLGWRVQKSNRSVVDIGDVPSLQIIVIATPMKMNDGQGYPEPCGDPKHHHEVTDGKPGGHMIENEMKAEPTSSLGKTQA